MFPNLQAPLLLGSCRGLSSLTLTLTPPSLPAERLQAPAASPAAAKKHSASSGLSSQEHLGKDVLLLRLHLSEAEPVPREASALGTR